MTSALVTSTEPSSRQTARRALLLRAATELSIATCVFAVYRAGRLVTNDSVASATANAEAVLAAQRRFAGALELRVQRWTLELPGAIDVLNHYYVYVHFPATIVFLVWAFARDRDRYPAIRNWFVGVTMAAMVIHMAFPLAPPRMLDGYVDTLRAYGPNIYPEDPSRSLANQFAAMPSLHFGWALMVAVGIILISTGRHRWWWLAHPVVTLLAIVATGNHYVLDAAVAGVLAAIVGAVVLARRRDRAHRADDAQPAEVGRAGRAHPSTADRRRTYQRCPFGPGRPSAPSLARGTRGVPCREDAAAPPVP